MPYFHQAGGKLHGNVLTALRRDGYPITRRMFAAAYSGSGEAVSDEVIRHIRKFTLNVGESDILNFASAGAYFQMSSGFLDLQFAISLSEHCLLYTSDAADDM
eukprot:10433017-Alexandrium_andersonii.AAC.1